MARLKDVALVLAGQSPPSEAVRSYVDGLPFLQGNAEFGPSHPMPVNECQNPPRVCAPGDILVSVRAPVGAINVADQAYGIGRGLNAVRAVDVEARFLKWWFLHTRDELQARAVGSTFEAITAPVLAGLRLPDVRVEDQQAIADYLDRETARIDGLIAEQQRLIALLRERRAAVVEGAVASLSWTTPFHAVTTLVQTGPFGSQLSSEEYELGGTPVINPSHMIGEVIVPDPRIAVNDAKAVELARHRLEAGDLIVGRRGELGRCAVVAEAAVGALCGTGSILIRLDRARIEPQFAALVFRSRRNRDALALASVGSTMDNLNSSIIEALRIPLPTLSRQRRLVDEIDEQVARIDRLMAEAQRFIELAQERRIALITAAVTGQIDVRSAA